MKTRFFLFLLIFSLHEFAGQEVRDSAKIPAQDSIFMIYKEKLDNYVGIRLDLNTNISKFSFINRPPLKNFDIAPNQDLQDRIAVSYKWLTLAVSFSPKIGNLNNTEKEKGKTKITGFDFNFNLKNTQHRLFYTKTKGYYLANSELYRTELNNNNIFSRYAKLPNFESLQVGSETSYFYNSGEFSKIFSRDKSEIQVKSTGSIVSFLGLYYTKIDGSDEVLPFLDEIVQTDKAYPVVNESYYATFGTGYAYNLILPKHFFVTVLGVPSLGLQYSRLQYPGNIADKNKKELTVSILSEASFGYNTKRWYTGILGNYTGFTGTSKRDKVAGTKGFAMLFVGYRIAPPKLVKKSFDYINRQF